MNDMTLDLDLDLETKYSMEYDGGVVATTYQVLKEDGKEVRRTKVYQRQVRRGPYDAPKTS